MSRVCVCACVFSDHAHHSKEEIGGHCKKTYCPLLYLNPFGFAMTKLNTPPGSTETYRSPKRHM